MDLFTVLCRLLVFTVLRSGVAFVSREVPCELLLADDCILFCSAEGVRLSLFTRVSLEDLWLETVPLSVLAARLLTDLCSVATLLSLLVEALPDDF